MHKWLWLSYKVTLTLRSGDWVLTKYECWREHFMQVWIQHVSVQIAFMEVRKITFHLPLKWSIKFLWVLSTWEEFIFMLSKKKIVIGFAICFNFWELKLLNKNCWKNCKVVEINSVEYFFDCNFIHLKLNCILKVIKWRASFVVSDII